MYLFEKFLPKTYIEINDKEFLECLQIKFHALISRQVREESKMRKWDKSNEPKKLSANELKETYIEWYTS